MKIGVITNAIWASFSTEMLAVREKVDMKKVLLLVEENKTNLFNEKINPDDLPKTLKKEIMYVVYGMPDDKKPKDYDDNLVNFMVDSGGYLKDFHYIDSETGGESQKYIYDETRDIIFKVEGTIMLGTTLHSYEYACKLKGLSYGRITSPDYIIETSSEMIKDGDIAYYEPNLENFRSSTLSIVYYQQNKTDNSKEISYILSGAKEIKVSGDNYVWYNYSSDNKIWANIKCESANEITSYWTWIPRYAYKISGADVDIKYVNLSNQYYDSSDDTYKSLEEGYEVAEAFKQDANSKGIWVSKYEPSICDLGYKVSTNPLAVNKPNLEGFNANKTYYITYDASGNEIATLVSGNEAPENWYDYTNKQWANIKCVNSDNSVAKELVSYWVWIPRYAYRVEQGVVEIIYIDTNNKALDLKYEGLFTIGTDDTYDFKVLEAFSQNGQELSGIWMSKYEPSHETIGFELGDKITKAANEPNLDNFDKNKTYYITYDASGNEKATLVSGNEAPSNWYDYTNKQWANIKCVNSNDGKELVSYWVWIPRYAYRIVQGQVEIIYIDKNNRPLDSKYNSYTIGTDDNSDFKVQEAFNQNGTLEGIWVSKYEPSYVMTTFSLSTGPSAVNKPNLDNFDKNKTYYITYDASGNEKATLVSGNEAPENWYDYTNKKWANIKCVNSNDGKELVSYWVWIPSYAYRVVQGQVEIIYVRYDSGRWVACDSKYNSYTIGTDSSSEFRVQEAFTQNGNLNGIWMSKYEPSEVK